MSAIIEQVELVIKRCPEHGDKVVKALSRQGYICPVDGKRYVLLEGDGDEPNALIIYHPEEILE